MKADCAERVHGAIIAVDVAVRLLSSLIVLSHMGSFTGCLGIVLLRIPSSRPSPRTFPQFVRVQVLGFLTAENDVLKRSMNSNTRRPCDNQGRPHFKVYSKYPQSP